MPTAGRGPPKESQDSRRFERAKTLAISFILTRKGMLSLSYQAHRRFGLRALRQAFLFRFQHCDGPNEHPHLAHSLPLIIHFPESSQNQMPLHIRSLR